MAGIFSHLFLHPPGQARWGSRNPDATGIGRCTLIESPELGVAPPLDKWKRIWYHRIWPRKRHGSVWLREPQKGEEVLTPTSGLVIAIQRSSGPAVQRSSGPAVQRSSGPAVQRSSDPASQHPAPSAQHPAQRPGIVTTDGSCQPSSARTPLSPAMVLPWAGFLFN